MELSGKVAVVTGGARGIGLATAKALVGAGATVAIGDLDEIVLKDAATSIGAAFHGRLDVTDADGYRAFLDGVEKELGPIDILVNNAGIMPVGHLHEESEALARRMFEINVFGVITGTKGVPGVKSVEPEDVAAGIIEALAKPRARVYVPKVGKALAGAQHTMPRRMMEALNAKLGGSTVFLDDVDQAERKAYEERARHS